MTKLLLAASAALTIAAPAFAAETAQTQAASGEVPVRAVSTRGVNFNDAAQARAVYVRLQTAAAAVCGQDIRCARDAVAAAVKSADKPVLTAMAGPAADRAFAGNDQ